MDQRKNIIWELKKFYKKLSEDFKVNNLILFGSRALNKKQTELSDIDLIIVSEDFKNMNFFERVSKMYDYWNLNYPVDFLCYTLKEFNDLRKKVSIVKEALNKGIQIVK